MGTGVGEAALIGAAVGGGTALLTGNDPLRGALLGGVTGGAGGAMFGGAAGAAGGAKAGAVGGAGGATGTNAAINSFSQSINPLSTATAASPTALSSTLQAAQIAPTTINTGIAGAVPNSGLAAGMGPGGLPEIGMNLNKAVNDVGLLGNFGGYDNLAFNRAMAPNFANTATQAVTDVGAQSLNPVRDLANSAQNLSGGITNTTGMTQAADPGFFDDLMDKYNKLGTMGKIGVGIGGGLGLTALTGGFNQPTVKALKEEENPFGLATYDREKYRAINPMRHNVYRPTYAAEGGEMHSYAQGGIAALAAGGMGGNTGYPMGQMDMTQYATPTQMPTSAQVVNADYEQKTDPYRGTPIGMAEGGTARTPENGFYAKGGSTASGSQVYYDPEVGKYYTLGASPLNPLGMFGIAGKYKQYIGEDPNSATGNSAADAAKAYIDQTAVPNIYKSGYQDYIEGTPMVTTPEAFPSSPNFIDAYNLLSATAPNIASTISPAALVAAAGAPATSGTTGTAGGMASGGIAGYSLGGYAAGGNPRLLKGPGDGMSDNIPATIGGRQPARLADGEFVVPADVVSHLGNGSTDAGAKHLYKMMDKVRKARTGSKKQGKQIKPGKFLPA